MAKDGEKEEKKEMSTEPIFYWAFVEPCRMTLFLISFIFSMNSHSLEIPMCVVKHLRATPTYLANYLKVTAKLIRRDVLFKGDG